MALTDGTVVRARAVTPKPDNTPVTKSSLINIKTRPCEVKGVITQDTPSKPHTSKDPPTGPSPSDPVPRGLRITRDLLERYSLAKGCPKCEAIRRNHDSNSVHHHRDCRKRVEQALAQDADDSQQLKEIEQRQNKYLARRVEEQDLNKTDGPPAPDIARE